MKKAVKEQLLKIREVVEEAFNDLTEIAETLQGEFDEKTEKWQESEKGEEALNKIEDLESGASGLEDVLGNIDAVLED